ncbi:hypothetical protein OG298_41200 [Streptomyces sp. NBC_01005]|uniref:hypothetical protein n=1 Tax=unclassified Streptomyces TaxID=2593676 RepID=UPI00386635E1|nr:hypothetical protein OG298_41200 [Streptomyces sp. NBC_01005]WTD00422.1 hypothetical protein OH736_41210 [Streptomyces sp. NBC_01650]
MFLRQRLGERRTLADALGGLLADLNRALRWFIEYVRGRFDGEELVLDAELVVLREADSAAANPPMTPGCAPG